MAIHFHSNTDFRPRSGKAPQSDSDDLMNSGYVPECTCGPHTKDNGSPKDISDEIRDLMQSASCSTEAIIATFHGLPFLRQELAHELSEICSTLRTCFGTLPDIRHSFVPPFSSLWCSRRAVLVQSLRRNLNKYLALSRRVVSKSLRIDAFRRQIYKLAAFGTKFTYLLHRLQDSTQKMRLMQLREHLEYSYWRVWDHPDVAQKERFRGYKAHFLLKISEYEHSRRNRPFERH